MRFRLLLSFVVIVVVCLASAALAEDIGAVMGTMAESCSTDMLGAIVAIGPWLLKVAAFVGGLLLLVGLIRFAATKLSGN